MEILCGILSIVVFVFFCAVINNQELDDVSEETLQNIRKATN